VRLFDSTNFLKAFGVGDVWVAVGWSSEVLPAVKRMSNVTVIVPKSGASLWADLWQEVIPGAPPSALESKPVEVPGDLLKGKPKLDTNLIAGVPPTEILARIEFLEPLSNATLTDYEWLIASIQKPDTGFINRIQHFILWSYGSFNGIS
ncbi:hypothetical protein Dsin_016212, partial [Dipteronia sinensis]